MSPENGKISPEEYSRNYLAQCARDYKIFIDTCSILDPASKDFWTNIIPFLEQYGNKVIVPLRVINELEKKRSETGTPVSDAAADRLKQLVQLMKAGLIEIRGDATDSYLADNVFLSVFTKFRMDYTLLLITQDKDLARDIELLNSSQSVRARKVYARKINRYGYLSPISSELTPSKGSNGSSPLYHPIDAFQVCTSLTQVPNQPVVLNHIPTEGELVYTSQGSISLQEKIGEGGEGDIYATNTPYVAKIYKSGKVTQRKQQKLSLMLSKPLDCPGICYPVAELKNTEGAFVGYLMPRAQGKSLRSNVFIPLPLLKQRHPEWKKRDMVELCITILRKFAYLHERNIILGDINPFNILMVSPEEVYLVDMDSYQVEGFPCPVGTTIFTAPEIQRRHYPDFLRTMGQENFAVATLLFMIMLPGQAPYAQQGGENVVDNIIRMDFSYPLGERSNKKTPIGAWRYMWSHLPYAIKEAFYETFRAGGKYAQEENRLTSTQWLRLFENYLDLLDSGKFGGQDKMSEELIPTRFKKNSNATYVTCSVCKQEVEERFITDGICQNCYRNSPWEIRTCVDCGERFTITCGERDFYQKRGFDLPLRCKGCREERKQERDDADDTEYSTSNSIFSSYSSPSHSSGSFCFITTAVCEYLGKNDDCVELNTLRRYRDDWLRLQPGGKALIEQYYMIAPSLVSRLKASAHYEAYCQHLWEDYIQPCLSLIADKQFVACREKYSSMVQYLQLALS